ncbi:MAG: hypothetical protein QOE45_3173 [Frankiaceae bacterium]|nr:hypothetical protein [Frankiaceae bacterium]
MTARTALAAAVAVALSVTPAHAAARPRELLPNLVALPTQALYVGGPGDAYVTSSREVVHGCDPADVAQRGARRCLRFDTIVANFGTGPFEIRTDASTAAGARAVAQRVYRSDGSYSDVRAGTFELDPAHAHFHITQFAVAALWRSTAGGVRLGRSPVRTGDKAGFCLEDVQHRGGNAEAAYTWPVACYPVPGPGGSLTQVQGISVGWSDVYDIAVPHQYVEISGVADGYYLLQVTVDPGHRVRERTTRDNVVWQRVRLCGNAVDLVGRTSACASGRPAPTPGALPLFGPPRPGRPAYCAVRP